MWADSHNEPLKYYLHFTAQETEAQAQHCVIEFPMMMECSGICNVQCGGPAATVVIESSKYYSEDETREGMARG